MVPIDAYSTALLNSKNIDISEYMQKYNADYANSFNRISALYNEVGADRTNVEQKRERYIYDDAGNVKLGPTNEPLIEEYTASDYDYNKQLIKNCK